MTRRERRSVVAAMKLIHSDEDAGGCYECGMDILAKLAGLKTMDDAMGDAIPVSIQELASRRNARPTSSPDGGKKEGV